jgi:hypothetical protein
MTRSFEVRDRKMEGREGPLFIVGYPRSGTTLLRALLGAHPQVHLFNEPEVFRGLLAAGLRIHDRVKPADRRGLLERMSAVRSCRYYLSQLPPEVLESFIGCPRDMTFKEVFEYLLPVPPGKERWGLKGLGTIFYLPALHALYPDATFIHIVRDPRSALLSYYRKKRAAAAERLPSLVGRDVRFFMHRSMQWAAWMRAVSDAKGDLTDGSFLQVKYEDLVTNPEQHLRAVCGAAGLSFDPRMLDTASRREDPILSSKGAFAHRKLSEPIDSSRAAAGQALPEWSCRLIEKYAGGEMAALGYAPARPRLGVATKVRLIAFQCYFGRRIQDRVRLDIASRFGHAPERPPAREAAAAGEFPVGVSV